MRGEERDFTIQVTEGKQAGGWLLGKHRNLELKNTAPLQITGVATDKDVLTIKLANATVFTRVHIAASRFEPGKGIFAGLGGFTRFGVASGTPAKNPNLFSAGRQIGDEYRYILERRYGKLYPGNMLTRPGLLLNPWEVRDTGLDELSLKAMQQAGCHRAAAKAGRSAAPSRKRPRQARQSPAPAAPPPKPTSTSSPPANRRSTTCCPTRTASCASTARRSATASTCRFMPRI